MTALTSDATETATVSPTETDTETVVATPTQSESAPEPMNSDVKACRDKDSPMYPICEPTDGQEVYVDDSYYGRSHSQSYLTHRER